MRIIQKHRLDHIQDLFINPNAFIYIKLSRLNRSLEKTVDFQYN